MGVFEHIPGLEPALIESNVELSPHSIFIAARLIVGEQLGAIKVYQPAEDFTYSVAFQRLVVHLKGSQLTRAACEPSGYKQKEVDLFRRGDVTSFADFRLKDAGCVMLLHGGGRLLVNRRNPSSYLLCPRPSDTKSYELSRIAPDLNGATATLAGIARVMGLQSRDSDIFIETILEGPPSIEEAVFRPLTDL